jgi:nucleotide-binding universal stress UspA family protein
VRTVIVPLDGSALAERALPPAVAMARATGAELELLQVVVDPAGAAEAHATLDGVAGRLRADDAGLVIRPPIVLEADWSAECIANAAEQPDSLVCLSTHGSTGVRRALLGSVAEDVARLAPGPVLLVGPDVPVDDDWALTGDLVVCVDGSSTSEAIVPAAAALAADAGLAPRVLTVGAPDAPIAPEDETSYVREVAAAVDAAMGRPAGTTPFEVLHDQHPGEAVVAAARAIPAAVIAMATHGKTGLARVAAGSVTTWVVRHAASPVMVLRPDPTLLQADEPPAG